MLAQSLIADRHFASAGFHSEEGRRPPATILEAARLLGADLSSHSSRLIDRTMVNEAHMILVMDTENLASMTRLFPEAVVRTLPLGIFHSPPRTTIHDPYASLDRTAQSAADIRASILGLRSWLLSV
jgi:protein-tyrosine-phosphatase